MLHDNMLHLLAVSATLSLYSNINNSECDAKKSSQHASGIKWVRDKLRALMGEERSAVTHASRNICGTCSCQRHQFECIRSTCQHIFGCTTLDFFSCSISFHLYLSTNPLR